MGSVVCRDQRLGTLSQSRLGHMAERLSRSNDCRSATDRGEGRWPGGERQHHNKKLPRTVDDSMGTAPSKLIETQSPIKRPFDTSRRKRLPKALLRNAVDSYASNTLQRLILRQDWQRVLIRAELYPLELREYVQFQLSNDIHLKLLPLHLVCALEPPLAVVDLLLKQYPEAASQVVRPLERRPPLLTKRKSLGGRLQHRLEQWWHARKGAVPLAGCEGDRPEEAHPLVRTAEATPCYSAAQQVEAFFSLDHDTYSNEESSLSSESSSSSSDRNEYNSVEKGVILQLSPTGGLQAMVPQSDETESTDSQVSESSLFRVYWDLQPLLKYVGQHGGLWPLHVACLYRASADVIRTLVEAYPAAVMAEVMDMLPIHWIAAGWHVPQPLMPRPFSLLTLPIPEQRAAYDSPWEHLNVLLRAAPESAHIASGHHGMTAVDYIQECMEEGDTKKACLKLLRQSSRKGVADDDDDDESSHWHKPHIFVDQEEGDEASSRLLWPICSPRRVSPKSVTLSTMFQQQNWKALLCTLEEDPSCAEKWLYGLDTFLPDHDQQDAGGQESLECQPPTVWKRLAIHLASSFGPTIPVGLMHVLLEANPQGVSTPDSSGSYPLHLACQSAAPLEVILILLQAYPAAAQAFDQRGQCPLHRAVVSRASLEVVQWLVHYWPESVLALDNRGLTPVDYCRHVRLQEKLGVVYHSQQKQQPSFHNENDHAVLEFFMGHPLVILSQEEEEAEEIQSISSS